MERGQGRPMTCPICASVDVVPGGDLIDVSDTSGVKRSISTARCRRCTHGFVTSALGMSWRDSYPAGYYTRSQPSVGRIRSLAQRLPIESAIDFVAPTAPPELKVLDVGCGNGSAIVELVHRGHVCVGFEIDPDAAAVARIRGAMVVVASSLEEANFHHGSFDLVLANHVIEHVRDPVATMRLMGLLSRPNGHVAVSVPNAGSIVAKVFGPAWIGHEVPRHMQLFTAESLLYAFGAAELTVVGNRFQPFLWPGPYFCNIRDLWRARRQIRGWLFRCVMALILFPVATVASFSLRQRSRIRMALSANMTFIGTRITTAGT